MYVFIYMHIYIHIYMTSKAASMTQSAQTTIPPYQP